MSPDPLHNNVNYVFLFRISQVLSGRDIMPLLNTTPAAAGCSVLSNKNRMSFHRSLFAVVVGVFSCKTLLYKVLSMAPNRAEAFLLYNVNLFA